MYLNFRFIANINLDQSKYNAFIFKSCFKIFCLGIKSYYFCTRFPGDTRSKQGERVEFRFLKG